MSDEIKVKRRKLAEYKTDPQNANKGTERGHYMLQTSIEKTGVGRSAVADKNDVFVAGNGTAEMLAEMGIEDMIEIETDGKTLVVVKRPDFDLTDSDPNNAARQYAYFDNRAGEVRLDWDVDQMLADMQSGLNLEGLFLDWELDTLLGNASDEFDPNAHWNDMPEFEHDEIKSFHSIIVHFKTEENLIAFASLVQQIVTIKTKYIYYPEQIDKDNTKIVFQDES